MKQIILLIAITLLIGCEKERCWLCTTNYDGEHIDQIICGRTEKEIREFESNLSYTYDVLVVIDTFTYLDTLGFYYQRCDTCDVQCSSYDDWYNDSYSGRQKYWTGECKFDTIVRLIKAPVEVAVTTECIAQ